MTHITISDRVTELGGYCFEGCTSLATVNCGLDLLTIGGNCFQNCTALTNVNLNQGLTRIDGYAFQNCTALQTIILPDTVTSLGEYAFQKCTALTDVTLSSGLTTIERFLFANDTSLEKIVIPHGVLTMKESIFYQDTKFTEVTIPPSVSEISSSNVFSYPAKLTVYGCSGSYAETYANSNRVKQFVDKTKAITSVSLADTVILPSWSTRKPDFAIQPEDYMDQLTLSSDNADIVEIVDGNRLYGKWEGTARVTATAASGYSCGFTVEVKRLNSISMTTPPAVTTYDFGEMPDYTGMVITAAYSDGTTSPVTAYTTKGYGRASMGEQTVTVDYFGKQTTFPVTTVKVVDGIITDGLSYTFNSGTRLLTLSGTIPAGCTVYAAEYDGRKLVQANTIQSTAESVEVKHTSDTVKIFLLNADFVPQCEAIIVL